MRINFHLETKRLGPIEAVLLKVLISPKSFTNSRDIKPFQLVDFSPSMCNEKKQMYVERRSVLVEFQSSGYPRQASWVCSAPPTEGSSPLCSFSPFSMWTIASEVFLFEVAVYFLLPLDPTNRFFIGELGKRMYRSFFCIGQP